MKLENFCIPEETRPYVKTPYNQGGYTYSSDGSIIVRVPKIDGYPDGTKERYPDCSKLPWKHQEISDWHDMPEFSISKRKCPGCAGTGKTSPCKECDGEGWVVYDTKFNSYEWECKSCKGEGVSPGGKNTCESCHGSGEEIENTRVHFIGGDLSARYLHLIKTELTGVKFGTIEKDVLCFNFDGGEGILMAMKT